MTEFSPSLSPPTEKNRLLEAALQYAALGWRVFPCHSPAATGGCTCKKADCKSIGKHPRTQYGATNATANTTTIRKWWKQWPDANVAIATAGFLVVDTDGPTAELVIAGHDLPPSPTAVTDKGRHRYFIDTAGTATNKVRIALAGVILPDQVDIRGTGGCVVAAPSLHASGRVYAWAPGLSPFDLAAPPAPQWLYDLGSHRPAPCRPSGGTVAPTPEGEPVPEGTQGELVFTSLTREA
ncbi:MAG: bifunctional DNA primase/polymerase, partial [Armatimonadota bacterium]